MNKGKYDESPELGSSFLLIKSPPEPGDLRQPHVSPAMMQQKKGCVISITQKSTRANVETREWSLDELQASYVTTSCYNS